jgi:hypothetical protein
VHGLNLERYYAFQLPAGATPETAAGVAAGAGQVDAASVAAVQSLCGLECRVFNVLENCTGNGRAYARLLYDTLLHHERLWIQWKMGSCPSNERVAGPEEEAGAGGKKRALGEVVAGSARCVRARPYAFGQLEERDYIVDVANGLVARVPAFDEIIEVRLGWRCVRACLLPNAPVLTLSVCVCLSVQRYKDAEDPDAGIDAEYHPKHDHVYCWRARRLMVARGNRLELMRRMADGDLSGAVTAMYPELAAALAELRAEREREEEEERARAAALAVEEEERAAAMESETVEVESTHPLRNFEECVESDGEKEREKEAAMDAPDEDAEVTHPLRDFEESISSP